MAHEIESIKKVSLHDGSSGVEEKTQAVLTTERRANRGLIRRISPVVFVRKSRLRIGDSVAPIERGATSVVETSSRGSITVETGFSAAWRKSRRDTSVGGNTPPATDHWSNGVYDSDILSYENTFRSVLRKRRIHELLEGRDGPVVVDLMAPSGTLADLFRHMSDDPKRLGIAVSLTDERKQQFRAEDEKLGIIQLAGDITRSRTWRELEKALGGRKADLIMERAYNGLLVLPQHSLFIRYAVQRMWQLLSENGGTLLLQVPSDMVGKTNLDAWKENIREAGIEIDLDTTIDLNRRLVPLRMVKRPDSPAMLPGLE